MTNKILNLIKSKYKLKPLDTGEFSKLKANGMTFNITAYHAEGLGHISVMTASGFLGLMKMDTIIITPDETDLPLYSYDRIYAMGNDTLLVELYDTMVTKMDFSSLETVKQKYSDLPERDPGTHWYDSIRLPGSISKKGKKKQSGKFDSFALEHFETYLNLPAPKLVSPEEKKKKSDYYVNGLLSNGGPSTDVFIKKFGKEKTEKLFKTVLF